MNVRISAGGILEQSLSLLTFLFHHPSQAAPEGKSRLQTDAHGWAHHRSHHATVGLIDPIMRSVMSHDS